MTNNQKKIFISYSKQDNKYKRALLNQLCCLRDRILTWNDKDIQPGEEWDARIKEELRRADIVLYLVTANSIATLYIQEEELPLIEERCQKGECVFVPIIVDFCHWKIQNFAKYNVLPEKGVPVTNKKCWVNQNEAWSHVIQGIERIILFELVTPPQQSYVGQYVDDIVIHAATKDLNFAGTFRTQLQKHLATKLGGVKFRLRLQTNNDNFSQAATVIVLWSESYEQQYGDHFQNLPHLQQKRLVLVEVDKTQKPKSLSEVMGYNFYQQQGQNITTYQVMDNGYQLRMAELSIEQYDLLQKIKNSQELSFNATVFINVAPEDRGLGEEVQKRLAEQYHIDSILPSTTGTRSDIGTKYQHCDAVLFIFDKGSEEWIDNQLLACGQAASEHQKQFKIVAIPANEQQNEKVNVSLPRLNLQEYFCPPETIQDYLPHFVEALK